MGLEINKRNLDRIILKNRPTDGKPILYFDTKLIGFGVKVNSRKVSYFVAKKVKGRSVRKSFGDAGLISLEEARKKAIVLLGAMASGIDINRKNTKIDNITLINVFEDYLESRKLTSGTLGTYRTAIYSTFKDWQNTNIRDIDRDMIEKLFREASERSPAIANMSFRLLRSILNHHKTIDFLKTDSLYHGRQNM
ncbi:hypothetical protein FACS1894152_5810 [Bacilli bacterium]|nr:hypothetical protein FACS1894152_5810 [Bacilli bacterium]